MLFLDGNPSPVYSLAFSQDGTRLGCGHADGSVLLWSEDGEQQTLIAGEPSAPFAINAVAFHPEQQSLLVGGENGWTLLPLSGSTNAAMQSQKTPTGLTSLRFLNPKMFVIGIGHRAKTTPGKLALQHLNKEQLHSGSFPPGLGVRSIDVIADRKLVACSEWGRKVSVWETTKPDIMRFNLSHESPQVALHPLGNQLAVAMEWGYKVFDLVKKQDLIANSKAHTGRVSCLTYSPDGRYFATGSWDGSIRVWDAQSGAECRSFSWGVGKIYCLAYSPDGLRMAAGGDKGTVIMWDVD